MGYRSRGHLTALAVLVATLGAMYLVRGPGPLGGGAASQPEFWLMAGLAVLAGSRAFVASRPAGSLIVTSPTLCFTFAILLCWGLVPAAVVHVVAIAAGAWRLRLDVRGAALAAAHAVAAFAASYVVLAMANPDPFVTWGPANDVTDALAVLASIVAWLGVFGLLAYVPTGRRAGWVRPSGLAGVIGSRMLFNGALLLLGPVLAVGAHVNVIFVPLIFVPLYAVERMGRLSADRDRAASLDPLTGLANRSALKSRFDGLIAEDGDASDQVALLILDLDRFKHVNDALGHETGDRLLVAVGERMASAGRDGIVARLGGDEFAVLARVRDADDARDIGHDVVSRLSEPVILDGLSVDVTASVGVALRPLRGAGRETFAILMRHADVAMYDAKQRGDTIAVYDSVSDHNTPKRLSLLTDFRRALESNDRSQISMHYQPQVSLDTGTVVGLEALLRWDHPTYGPMRTDEILGIAEHTSVMHLLTSCVIDEVFGQVARWAADGIHLRVSINVSARDLYSGDLVSHMSGELSRYGISPEQIQVEITESALMTDPARARATVSRIAALGVHVALDDFGTGYSSLQHLRRLPITEIKIDRSFVAGMAHDSDDAAIVASTVGMARSLGLRTVAEGVENEYTRQMLAATGCTLAQGWYAAKAMPASELRGWLVGHGQLVDH